MEGLKNDLLLLVLVVMFNLIEVGILFGLGEIFFVVEMEEVVKWIV